MVATELNRLPSFKSRRTLSPLENEPRERKSNPEKNLSSDREPSANSGLDIETKHFSAGRRRSFFVDIPSPETSSRVRHCDLETQLGCFLSEELDLLSAVSVLVVLSAFVNVVLTILQHAIDQSSGPAGADP